MGLYTFAVAADEPGERLVLERQEIPTGVAGCAVTIVAALGLAPLGIGYVTAQEASVSSLAGRIVLLLGGSVTLGLILYFLYRARSARVLSRLSADRVSGRLEIVEGPLFEGAFSFGCSVATQSVALTDVAALQVRGARHVNPQIEVLKLLLNFGFREGSGVVGRRFDLTVQNLSRTEEVLDLAQRLAVVVGLAEQRLLQNDPREVAIEFTGPALRWRGRWDAPTR